ncbi:MAG: hypothetical protein M1484_03985 [Patescibacteria group bacterium]|nr:hypothetical protein [Patescibacteria group bacterium]MCL5432219.1 hypothetical protein [Patescibacteria group bacterium]
MERSRDDRGNRRNHHKHYEQTLQQKFFSPGEQKDPSRSHRGRKGLFTGIWKHGGPRHKDVEQAKHDRLTLLAPVLENPNENQV